MVKKCLSVKEQQKQFQNLHILIKDLVNEDNPDKLAKYLINSDNLKRQRDQNSLNRSRLNDDDQLEDQQSSDEGEVIIKRNTVVAS